jgi:hypothetical protein
MATLKAVTVGERIEIERAQIESVGHPELRASSLTCARVSACTFCV